MGGVEGDASYQMVLPLITGTIRKVDLDQLGNLCVGV